MLASSATALSVVIVLAAILGPVIAVGIFWFGLRSARRHDERHGP
jgi:hypothetical protein